MGGDKPPIFVLIHGAGPRHVLRDRRRGADRRIRLTDFRPGLKAAILCPCAAPSAVVRAVARGSASTPTRN